MEKYLVLILFVSGVSNVILIKWADKLIATGSSGNSHFFEHPFLQTALLFFSQLLCFGLYQFLYFILKRRQNGSEERCILTAGNRDFHPTIFFLPAVLDVIASSMLFIGIFLTYGSSFQIIQGLLVVFSTIFTSWFFDVPIKTHHWIGMKIIFLAVIGVGGSDFISHYTEHGNNVRAVITGDLFIGCAQIFKGIQIVYEERYVRVFNIAPLHAIGWEGVFGFVITFISLIPLSYLKAFPPFNKNSHAAFEDVFDAYSQIENNYMLLGLHLIFMISVGSYYFAGMSISKKLSANHLCTFDCLRTIVIFFISMIFEWERFYTLQLVSFIMLFCGLFIYKYTVIVYYCRRIANKCRRQPTNDTSVNDILIQPADEI